MNHVLLISCSYMCSYLFVLYMLQLYTFKTVSFDGCNFRSKVRSNIRKDTRKPKALNRFSQSVVLLALFAVTASASLAHGADTSVGNAGSAGKDKPALSKLDMKHRVPARMIQQKTSVSRTKKVESEIDLMLKAFSKAYVGRDIIDVMSYYSTEPDTIAIGSNEDEKFIGPEMIKEGYLQDFFAARQLKYFDIKVLALSSYGNVAWLFADANAGVATKQQTIDVKGRFTAVLKHGGSGWKFVQTHFSLPAPTPGENGCNTIKLPD